MPRQTLADFPTRVAAFSPGLTAVALPDLFFGGKKMSLPKTNPDCVCLCMESFLTPSCFTNVGERHGETSIWLRGNIMFTMFTKQTNCSKIVPSRVKKASG